MSLSKLKVLAIAALVGLTCGGHANANLVTIEMDGVMSARCAPCTNLHRGTGLSLLNPLPLVPMRFTIDTAPLLYPGSDTYLFDQPGTGMRNTLGKLTIFYSSFELSLDDGLVTSSGACNNLTDSSGTRGPTERGSFFNTSDCSSPGTNISDLSLDGFASGALNGFHGTPLDTAVNAPLRPPYPRGTGHWKLAGHVDRVHDVPEPPLWLLLALGLVGIGVARRRVKRREAHRALAENHPALTAAGRLV